MLIALIDLKKKKYSTYSTYFVVVAGENNMNFKHGETIKYQDPC